MIADQPLARAWNEGAIPPEPQDNLSAREARARDLYKSCAYNHRKHVRPAQPIYKLCGIPIATAGNLLAINAPAGCGKSSLVAAGLAAPMRVRAHGTQPESDCLGLESENPLGHGVLHLDTEQSQEHYYQLVRRALKRARLSEPHPWFLSCCLTGREPSEIVHCLEVMLKDANEEFNGIHSVWLDGIGDCVTSPNDEAETKSIVRKLHKLAIEYKCVIASVLHLNHGSQSKMRGHLGSEIERKAETVLALKKSLEGGREVVTVHATPPAGKARNAPIPEQRGPRFTWNDDAGMHMRIESKDEARQSLKEQETFELATAVWGNDPQAGLPHKEVVARLLDYSRKHKQGRKGNGFSERTAQTRIPQMVECGAAWKDPHTGHYHLREAATAELRRRSVE